jgi:flagellar assembly protein FliH
MSMSSDAGWAAAEGGTYSFEYPVVQRLAPELLEAGLDDGDGRARPRVQEEWETRIVRAREEGRREGESEARRNFEDALLKERAQLANAIMDFGEERKNYFAKVEKEVVELALTIARKVLHRESQIDRLLLAGIVRVSIERLPQGSEVVLRVPDAQTEEWKRYFATAKLPFEPTVVGDNNVPSGECVISTELGNTVLGLEKQLQEIESGLFDLMAPEPRA